MNIKEVLERLDALFAQNRMEEVEPFLTDRLAEALEKQEDGAVITILNELIGFYRDTSRDEKAVACSKRVLAFMESLGLAGTVAYATTLLNTANAYRAAGHFEESLNNYEQVLAAYEKELDRNDFRFASLYNNLSLLYQETGRYEDACAALERALGIVTLHPEARFELAVTYANLGATRLRIGQMPGAREDLEKALGIFGELRLKDSHYCAALSAMGELTFREGKYEEAAGWYEEALTGMEINVGKTQGYRRIQESLETVYEKMGGRPKRSGMELCQEFYEHYGRPMLHEKFPDHEGQIAAGLVGEGSECYGFDDEISMDHDFGPGFCLWVTEELYEEIGERLQKEYDRLPSTYRGIERRETAEGAGRMGVHTIQGFYSRLLGIGGIPQTTQEWLGIGDEQFAAAVNGKVFSDPLGEFSRIRDGLSAYYPEQARLLKIARESALFSQAGQYNFSRMHKRGESVSAFLALSECIRHGMQLVFLLSRVYCPYDKWKHRALKRLPGMSGLAPKFEQLAGPMEQGGKEELVEEIAAQLLLEMRRQGITAGEDTYLAGYSRGIISRAQEVSMDREALAEKIVQMEWEAFDKVKNEGGRASCQDDWGTFRIMRKSQYMSWPYELLREYRREFQDAVLRGWNPVMEKYARMMESTAPERYAELKEKLPELDESRKEIIEQIVRIQVGFMESFAARYPKMAANARKIHTSEDTPWETSYETYLRGEISTYSPRMLEMYGRFIAKTASDGMNPAEMIMRSTAQMYGYQSLEEAEEKI